MITETGRIFHIPYKGGTLSVNEELFTDMNSGKKAYELANDSVPLADIMRLANIGRNIRLEMPGTERYSDIEKEAATSVDSYLQARLDRGAFARDYAFIEPNRTAISGTQRPKGDYVAVKFFHNATGIEKRGEFEIIEAEEEADLWLPRSNGTIIVPGRYGDSNRFGLPEETVADIKKAIPAYKEAFSNAHYGKGITDKEARDMLSKLYSFDNGWATVRLWSGRDVDSWCVLSEAGCFASAVLLRRPLDGLWGGGRFAASRSRKTDAEGVDQSGARQAAENEGRVSYTLKESRDLEEKAVVFYRIVAEADRIRQK